MKRIRHFSIWIVALIGLTTLTNSAQAQDVTKPTPGGYEAGYPKVVGNTIKVKWTRGTDNVTTQANLRYQVALKKASEINWKFSDLVSNMTGYTINGLEPYTEYEVNVLVLDEAGNGAWYGKRTVKTQAADTEKPTPGSYVSGYPQAISPTEIKVKWTRGTDNVTTQANLRYVVSWNKIPASDGSWKYSHLLPFTSFPKDWTEYTITGLEPNTEYVVDVVVYDEAENRVWYGERTVKTQAADTEKPTPGSYVSGYPQAISPTEIKVKWTRASDNVTTQANLRYQVSLKKASEIKGKFSDPVSNMTGYTITGLEPNTEYVVDVRVVDEAGNGAWYGERTVKTRDNSVIVTGVTVSPASLNVEVGATGTLTASVAPDNASVKTVTWSSSDAAVATVDGSGTVKGIAPGTATITVKTSDGGKTATATVTVKEATAPTVKVTSVTLNRSSVTINGDYEEIRLTATVAPATATDKSLTWTSDNPKVASVDATGLVTIHKKGKATITVTANDGSGQSASCNFDVIMTVGNDAVDGLRVYAAGGQLHLTLPKAQTVHIYNVNGAIVKTLALPAGDYVQPLAPGVYVVRVGERVTKVALN